jgi:ribose 5-phosphate isomerase B
MPAMPKVYLATDHAGFALKEALRAYITELGHEVEDMGALELSSDDDYPDFVLPCAKRVAGEAGAFGIIFGGSGNGEAMAANRVSGARAAVFYAERGAEGPLETEGTGSHDGFDIVRLARLHNDANILSIGARFVSLPEAQGAIRVFLETAFSGDERHVRRIGKF